VATDAGGSLAERLGPAEQYAQELRTAYGVAHADATRQNPLLRDVTVAISRVTTSSWYRQVRAFLPELRPGWRVLRPYPLVLVLTRAFSPSTNLHPIPNPFSSRGLLEIVEAVIEYVL